MQVVETGYWCKKCDAQVMARRPARAFVIPMLIVSCLVGYMIAFEVSKLILIPTLIVFACWIGLEIVRSNSGFYDQRCTHCGSAELEDGQQKKTA